MATQSLKISIYDHATGETIERDMTEEEIQAYRVGTQAKADRIAAQELAQQKKESARAKLATLGLDSAEIQAILGA